jgi:hypothetical protein
LLGYISGGAKIERVIQSTIKQAPLATALCFRDVDASLVASLYLGQALCASPERGREATRCGPEHVARMSSLQHEQEQEAIVLPGRQALSTYGPRLPMA